MTDPKHPQKPAPATPDPSAAEGGGGAVPPRQKASHQSRGVAPPRARYTQQVYDRILAGYRGAPGNHAAAARFAQVDKGMARNAWYKGFPRQRAAGAVWARPIVEVLKEEQDAARVRQAELNRREREADDAARELARREHVEELAEEGKLRSALRKDLLAAAVIMADMVPATRALANVVKGAVLDPATNYTTALAQPQVDPLKAMRLLKEWGATVARVAYAGETIVQLGRTVRGQSNVNVGKAEDMSPEEALEELEMAKEVLEHRAALREELAQDPAEGGPKPVH